MDFEITLRKVSRHREASSINFIIAELVAACCCICRLGTDNAFPPGQVPKRILPSGNNECFE